MLKYTPRPTCTNGMLKSLDDVIAFYNKGGGKDSRKSKLLKPLKLSKQERRDLKAFLLSMSR